MNIKPSRFNHKTVLDNGDCILYNFFSGKCIRLNTLTADYYENPELYGERNKKVQQLQRAGFLVDFDEISWLHNLVYMDCGRTSNLSLAICPTLQCNFSCPYCFETARPGNMTSEIQDKVIAFAERLIQITHPKDLSVTWYGGEPLLAPEVIRALSEKLIAICEKDGIKYNSQIVTNGYCLSKEAVKLFEEFHIKEAQITLDGPDAETHNHTRHLKSGGGTFDHIMENIHGMDPNCKVSIRCNVGRDNVSRYYELKEKFQTIGEQFHVYPGYLEGHDTCSDMEIPYEDYALMSFNNSKEPKTLRFKGAFCKESDWFYFVIDEQGNLYKCWEQVGNANKVIGNISSFDPMNPFKGNTALLSDFMEMAWPGEDAECMACPILPACMGGCPIKRKEGAKRCLAEKYCLDEYVLKVAEGKGLCKK